ncbi:hypothetical protein AB0L40_06675 [Patulibacter sp. NPDC049589]|uniref:hypothetical protein n=1 Tax=Patulibacter sp. NPDC049589 TaxID=3154731 RepID=UPI00342241E1
MSSHSSAATSGGRDHDSAAVAVGTRAPSFADDLGRRARSADVVLARLIADEASFARRVRRVARDRSERGVPSSLLGEVTVDPDRLA